MDLKTRGFIAFLVIFAGWMGWKYFTRPEYVVLETTPTPTVFATPEPTRAPATREDIAQLLAVPIVVTASPLATDSGNLAFATQNRTRFVTLFGDAIASTSAQRAITTIKQAMGPDTLIAVDQEGGAVQRLSGRGFTKLPPLQTVCTQPEELRRATFATAAAELAEVGVNVVFAPVVDLASDSAVLKGRTCSDDQILTTTVAQEAITEFQAQQILPVVKHFPGIGGTTRDLHNELDALYQRPQELEVFETVLELHPKIGVMTTFVLVSGLAENAPCGLDFNCVIKLTEYSKEALIFTDALEMSSALTGEDLVSEKSLTQVSEEALLAGNHVLVYGRGVTAEELEEVLNTLVTEYDTNEVLREKIDRALVQLEQTRSSLLRGTLETTN